MPCEEPECAFGISGAQQDGHCCERGRTDRIPSHQYQNPPRIWDFPGSFSPHLWFVLFKGGERNQAAGEGPAPHLGLPCSPTAVCRGDPTEMLNAAFVCAQAICARHRHGPGSQAAIWDLQAELQEAARSSPLVLLNSMTIPGLTFSTPSASGTAQPSSRLQQGPTVSIKPPV